MIYIAFLLFTFLVLVFVFYQWQYFMVFTPVYYRDKDLDDRYQILTLFTDDDVELEGVVYEPENFSDTILFFAGRNHDVVGVIEKLSYVYENCRIVTFNYRSYGKSGGVATEKMLLSDALKIAEVVEKNYGEFYLLGFSLGTSMATYVASKHNAKALFLIGAFDSIPSLAREKYLGKTRFFDVDISRFLRYKFDTVTYLKSVTCKTYIFVSKDDEIIYLKNARRLKESASNLTYYHEYSSLSHKELFWDKNVTDTIKGFIGC